MVGDVLVLILLRCPVERRVLPEPRRVDISPAYALAGSRVTRFSEERNVLASAKIAAVTESRAIVVAQIVRRLEAAAIFQRAEGRGCGAAFEVDARFAVIHGITDGSV